MLLLPVVESAVSVVSVELVGCSMTGISTVIVMVNYDLSPLSSNKVMLILTLLSVSVNALVDRSKF